MPTTEARRDGLGASQAVASYAGDAAVIEDHDAFLAERCGSIGASEIAVALSVLKKASGGRLPGDPTQSAIDLMYGKTAERFTGFHPYANPLRWGNDHEAEAIDAYAMTTNEEVISRDPLTGERMVNLHPRIKGTHASPDALVGLDGGLEVKCPTSMVHLKTLDTEFIPEEYLFQIHWNMACSGRLWWDFCSFDPRFPSKMQRFIYRVQRDEVRIAEMEKGIKKVLAGENQIIRRITEKYGKGEQE